MHCARHPAEEVRTIVDASIYPLDKTEKGLFLPELSQDHPIWHNRKRKTAKSAIGFGTVKVHVFQQLTARRVCSSHRIWHNGPSDLAQ